MYYCSNSRVCYDMMEDLCKSGQVSSRFSDFKGGVNLGLGTFNLVSTSFLYFPGNDDAVIVGNCLIYHCH